MRLSLGTKINLAHSPYRIIGIDYYRLTNIAGTDKKWTSYTLKNKRGQKQWLIRGIFKNDIICQSGKPSLVSRIKIDYLFNPTLSGIARIGFEGNKGFSTPCAEILWFDKNCPAGEYQFFAIERFLDNQRGQLKIETYFYTGKLIDK